MNPDALAALVNDVGIPTTAGRASAIRQHVLEMPAPIVADALSYHPVTTAKLAAQAAGTWSRYAPGDHLRPGNQAKEIHDRLAAPSGAPRRRRGPLPRSRPQPG
jgi:hypothetical protein